MVEAFERRQVTGWVEVRRGARPVQVRLCVNDIEVARTWAADRILRRGSGDMRGFRLALRDIWQYCQRTDRVTVQVDGVALPIAGRGTYLRPHRDGEQSLAALQAKLAAGCLFGQGGRLQLSKTLDADWQRGVLDLYERVRAIVADEFGYDSFVCYGTLLGAVREHGFIGHDLDFDAAYVSKHTDPRAAAEELRDIGIRLAQRGLWVRCKRTALHIYAEQGSTVRIDLFHLFFRAGAGELSFPFGVAGTTRITQADWAGTVEGQLCGRAVALPADAEALVEHIYGATWRTPKPGFSWDLDRTTRAEDAALTDDFVEEVYWANFYAHMALTEGSPFCEYLGGRPDTPMTVIDFGCGDGRDSIAFALAGRRVVGMDRSAVAIGNAARTAAAHGVAENSEFLVCDLGDAGALRAAIASAIAARPDTPALFYARFLLHSIPADVQDTLMGVIAELARPGDVFAAEFRTDKDETNEKVFGGHYRRFQNGPEFGVTLETRHGFTIIDSQHGTGLSPYGDEDPELYRVVARR
jgi:SAM-dependent methyltransferase